MKNIGFIGVGYMGYGIAKNILKHKNKLFVIANKNRNQLIKLLMRELKKLNHLRNLQIKI
jgi:3-hydroxyisobutyrate dehydrogenase-like beta-hydroxyacid dehydrogenase